MSRTSKFVFVALAAVALAECAAFAIGANSAAAQPKQISNPDAQPMQDQHCVALGGLHLDSVEILSATAESANAPVAGVFMPDMTGAATTPLKGLPPFCRVIGKIHPEPDSDINFEVWLPVQWDGRLNGAGNGGFAGTIDYMTMSGAVTHGQVAAGTDTGHQGAATDGSWAKDHPARIRDFGWRAIHLTAVTAKELISDFYGRKPDHSYFAACSDGGREALMEASRFPDDYDGISAGAPAANITDLAMSMIWTVQSQMPPNAPIRDDQVPLLQAEVLKQCDTLDGQADGLVADARACKLDVSKLACGINASPACFAPEQVKALRSIYAGPHDSRGHLLEPPYTASGAEVDNPWGFGYGSWMFGKKGSPASHAIYPAELLQYFTHMPTTVASFNWDKDPVRLRAALSADLDVQPNLRRYFERGGKLVIYHGWADPAIPPGATLNFYKAMLQRSGPLARKHTRLFMIPGMQHCFGGTGPAFFGEGSVPAEDTSPEQNIIAALQDWVEKERIPETLIGTFFDWKILMTAVKGDALPPDSKQRLICAYPQKTVLRAGQDPDKAASYTCRS